MEELKIGQYIRTKKGRIAKVTTINEIKYTYHTAKARNRIKFVGQKRTLINGRYEFEDIEKHSSDIIEILEKRDIVTIKFRGLTVTKLLSEEDIADLKSGELKLVSVLTHEQFEAAKYEVNHASNIT